MSSNNPDVINKPKTSDITMEEAFSWSIMFKKDICSSIGNKSYTTLDNLLLTYLENISQEAIFCFQRPSRAAKLSNHISRTLTFFYYYWLDVKQLVDDHNLYLNKMADILVIYLDMELKATNFNTETWSNITPKLLTALYIYLDESIEHIFRVLFKSKSIAKTDNKICEPIFAKCFSSLNKTSATITDTTYVCHLLALKLWKKVKGMEDTKIDELAIKILGNNPPNIMSAPLKLLPVVPSDENNKTLWWMKETSFDLRKCCNDLIKYEDNLQKSLHFRISCNFGDFDEDEGP